MYPLCDIFSPDCPEDKAPGYSLIISETAGYPKCSGLPPSRGIFANVAFTEIQCFVKFGAS